MNKIILGIIVFIAIALGLIAVISDASGSAPLPDVQQVHIQPMVPVVAPRLTQAPAQDDWDPFGDHTPPPLIPPVGPITVTGLGTGGMGLLA